MNMAAPVSDSEGSQLSRSDDLLRRLRHDLSNHVNQIIGFSELVSEELADADPVDSDLVESLDKVHGAAQSIQSLVREKLTLEGLSITLGREIDGQDESKQNISSLCDESLKIIQESKHIVRREYASSLKEKSKVLLVDDEKKIAPYLLLVFREKVLRHVWPLMVRMLWQRLDSNLLILCC